MENVGTLPDGFNPTLVRLRRLPCWSLAQLYRRFNPTLVRLRPFLQAGDELLERVFQSHAGSIEARMRGPLAFASFEVFQSHAGSIEAKQREKDAPDGLAFQSHAGSIEAFLPTGSK